MNKKLLYPLFIFFTLIFVSCSEMYTPSTGSISVSLNNAQRALFSEGEEEQLKLKLIVTGDEDKTVTGTIIKKQNTNLTIDDVKTGSIVNVRVEVLSEDDELICYGEHNNLEIKSGVNNVTIKLTDDIDLIKKFIPDFSLIPVPESLESVNLMIDATTENGSFDSETKFIWKLNGYTLSEEESSLTVNLVENTYITMTAENTVNCEAVLGNNRKSVLLKFRFSSEEDEDGNIKIVTEIVE